MQSGTRVLRKAIGHALPACPVIIVQRRIRMRKVLIIAAVVVALTSISFAAETFTPAVGIRGNYIEARTADVYTGPCVANGEAEQVGREAIFGWKIDAGSWKGV